MKHSVHLTRLVVSSLPDLRHYLHHRLQILPLLLFERHLREMTPAISVFPEGVAPSQVVSRPRALEGAQKVHGRMGGGGGGGQALPRYPLVRRDRHGGKSKKILRKLKRYYWLTGSEH